MGGPDPRGDSSASILGVTVARGKAGSQRLIVMMMMLPFTVGMSVVAIGAAMAIGWWRSAGGLPGGTTEMVKLHLELEGDMGEVVRVLRRRGGRGTTQAARFGMGRVTPQRRREQRQWALFRSPGTTAASATLLPGRWTEELAADFMAGLEPAGRRVALHVWRAAERGIHRNTLCQRATCRWWRWARW